jgi:Ca-activated chloride channel family protein
MRLKGSCLARACAAALSLVLAAAPAFFVSDSAAQTPAPRATPQPTPVRVPQLDPSGPPPRMPTPIPHPTGQPPAEQPPADAIDEDEIITVTSNLVVVPVSVTDASGQPVSGLKAADFRLEEEGRAQEIAHLGDAEQTPLDIALLFDVSSSAKEEFAFQQEAAARFLKQVLKPIDRAAIFTIAERPQMAQPLASGAEALAGLSKLRAAEKATGTAFYDTVMAAAKYLGANAPERNRRVILVITDGEDNFSDDVRDATVAELDKVNRAQGEKTSGEKLETVGERTAGVHRRALQRVMREVQQADAVFYSINPSGPGVRLNVISQRAEYGMQQLSEATGGSSFLPAQESELAAIFRRIAAELRAQYLLQYYSSSDAAPGKFLKIRVTTPARADLRVRARQGYYVQRQK